MKQLAELWTQLSDILKATVIVSVLALVASLLLGGVYQLVPTAPGAAYLVNRFTGSTMFIRGSHWEDVRTAPTPAAGGSN